MTHHKALLTFLGLLGATTLVRASQPSSTEGDTAAVGASPDGDDPNLPPEFLVHPFMMGAPEEASAAVTPMFQAHETTDVPSGELLVHEDSLPRPESQKVNGEKGKEEMIFSQEERSAAEKIELESVVNFQAQMKARAEEAPEFGSPGKAVQNNTHAGTEVEFSLRKNPSNQRNASVQKEVEFETPVNQSSQNDYVSVEAEFVPSTSPPSQDELFHEPSFANNDDTNVEAEFVPSTSPPSQDELFHEPSIANNNTDVEAEIGNPLNSPIPKNTFADVEPEFMSLINSPALNNSDAEVKADSGPPTSSPTQNNTHGEMEAEFGSSLSVPLQTNELQSPMSPSENVYAGVDEEFGFLVSPLTNYKSTEKEEEDFAFPINLFYQNNPHLGINVGSLSRENFYAGLVSEFEAERSLHDQDGPDAAVPSEFGPAPTSSYSFVGQDAIAVTEVTPQSDFAAEVPVNKETELPSKLSPHQRDELDLDAEWIPLELLSSLYDSKAEREPIDINYFNNLHQNIGKHAALQINDFSTPAELRRTRQSGPVCVVLDSPAVRAELRIVNRSAIMLTDFHVDPSKHFTSLTVTVEGPNRSHASHLNISPRDRQYLSRKNMLVNTPYDLLHIQNVTIHDNSGHFRERKNIENCRIPDAVSSEFSRTTDTFRSGRVVLLTANAFRIEDLSYSGDCPAAFFWAGQGNNPELGFKIPSETSSLDPVSRYFNKTITLKLPHSITLYDVDYVGMFCPAKRQMIAELLLPKRLFENYIFPPAFLTPNFIKKRQWL